MKEVNIDTGRYLMIEVPATTYEYYFYEDGVCFKYDKNEGKCSLGWDDTIPSGNWVIIGKGDEIDATQWERIVNRYVYSGRSSYWAYKDYSKKRLGSEDDIIIDPVESGHSWIKSNGFESSKVLILKAKDNEQKGNTKFI